jgi:valyl-tRNA synthetase
MGQFGRQRLGLPLIVDILESAGLAGTFFVDPFTEEQGFEGQTEPICAYLLDRGQDVQLHIHPNHWHFGLKRRGLPHKQCDDLADLSAEEQFALLRELIRLVRNARAEHDVPPKQAVNVAIEAEGAAARLIAANLDLLKGLANVSEAAITAHLPAPPANAAAVTVAGVKLYVLDIIDRQAELSRLTRQAESLRKGVAGIEGKLGNANFVARAPADVVARERERLERLRADLNAVEKALRALG